MSLARRRLQELDPEAREAFRRDCCLGSEVFRKQQLERVEGGLGEHHAGELRLETPQAMAHRLVTEELRQRGWDAEHLVRRRKKDPGKLAIAGRLGPQTTPSIKPIAARLALAACNTANARLHRTMKDRFRASESALPTPGK